MRIAILITITILSLTSRGQEKDPRVLLEKAVAKVGGIEKLYQKRDVTFRYTYGKPTEGAVDVSLEKYMFGQ